VIVDILNDSNTNNSGIPMVSVANNHVIAKKYMNLNASVNDENTRSDNKNTVLDNSMLNQG
jgi:hypothetical protein